MPKEHSLKRKAPSYSPGPGPADTFTPSKKKKPRTTTTKEPNQYPSVNDLKRRIRDVKRLLNKVDLPADARIVQERALAGYEKNLADEMRRRERSRMIKKYHFVRFLDRKTAQKELNRLVRKKEQLVKSTSDDDDDGDVDVDARRKKLVALESRIHIARVNLNYTIYYPLTEKYVSIYAEKQKKKKKQKEDKKDGAERDREGQSDEEGSRSDSSEDGGVELPVDSGSDQRKAMWRTVEKCMQDGTLDLLREGKLDSNRGEETGEKLTSKEKKASGTTAKPVKTKEKGEKTKVKSSRTDDRRQKSSKTRASPPMQDEDGGESDGGFFEM